MSRVKKAFLLVLMVGSIHPVQGGGFDFSGYTAGEMRFFTEGAAFSDQRNDSVFSYALEPEFRYQNENGSHQFTLVPFFRLDSIDSRRTHLDLREVYWRHTQDEWEWIMGVNKVFWGVAESRHLVNVINQNDGVEEIDEEDKLGQPMVMLATQRDWGRVSLFFLPYFRERTFPGKDGRLRPPLSIRRDKVEYESGAEEWHTDVAIRYAHYLGDWDFGAYYFYGTGREPLLLPDDRGDELVAFYEIIHQLGTELQYTRDAWLWKFEGILREGQGDLFAAAVGGFEYTHYQVLSSAADLGLLLEYHLDGRDEEEAPTTLFENDTFVGTRLALNDVQDTQVLLGAVIDSEDTSTFLFAEAERRIGDTWKVEIESRFFTNVDDGDPAFAFHRDDFINVSLQRHF